MSKKGGLDGAENHPHEAAFKDVEAVVESYVKGSLEHLGDMGLEGFRTPHTILVEVFAKAVARALGEEHDDSVAPELRLAAERFIYGRKS